MKKITALVKNEYFVAALILFCHFTFVSKPGRKAHLASSNLMTNLIRIEAIDEIKPTTLVLAGSSITGRLSESYFSQRGYNVVNMGLDGCGSGNALHEILAAGKFPEKVIIEINTLTKFYTNSFEVVRAARNPTRADLALKFPFLQACERPVDLFYASLHKLKEKAKRDEVPAIRWTERVGQKTKLPPFLPDNVEQQAYLNGVRTSLKLLKSKGIPFCFLLIPRIDSFNSSFHDEAMANAGVLSKEFKCPIYDLRECLGTGKLAWTDGSHLTMNSARGVCQFLERDILPIMHPVGR